MAYKETPGCGCNSMVLVDNDEFKREKIYQATMQVAKNMLVSGLITKEEYLVIDSKMEQKYKPIFGNLLSQNSLIKETF